MFDVGEEVKVQLPKKFCDYWWEKPKTWKIKKTGICDYCPEPLSKGEEYFEIDLYDGEVKRGHLHHLDYAEPVEWIPKEPSQ